MPKVSIIITNYNGKKYLENCLGSLKVSSFQDFEIIIVDNGSDDNSIDFLKDNYPEIKLLELGSNLGLSVASNRGREVALGKYLFFYNNDTIADKNMLAELVKAMESDTQIGVCGCRTVTYDARKEINCGVEMDIFGYPYGYGAPFYVDAGILIRKDVFDKIGGFDEKMFLYCEDRDLCWRAWLYGYKVVVVPTAIFRHDSFCLVEGNNFSTNIKRRFMNEAFTLRMLLKNYSIPILILILPLYILINFAEIFVYLIKREISFVYNTYFSAYIWNFKNLKDTLRKRKIIQKNRKISDIKLMGHLYKFSGRLLLFTKIGLPKVIGRA